jgi:cytochrome c oxidase cbb3-type subunit 4
MDLQDVVVFAKQLWVLWLGLLFLGIVVWAYWPSRRRRREMERNARIPLDDDDASDGAGGR